MIGKKLKELRKLAGLTQSDVAERMGYDSIGPLSKWETERDPIPEDRYRDLATALGITEKELRASLSEQEPASTRETHRDVIAAWRDQVAEAEIEEGVRFLLLCLPVFADEETRVVAITKEDFAKRLHLDVERVDRDWPKMLTSGFVERLGSPGVSDQVLKLRFS